MNNFLLTYDPLLPTVRGEQLLQYIKDSRSIAGFHSPYLGTVVLKSDLTVHLLAEQFRGIFIGAPFLLSQIYPVMTGGSQPHEVWAWLNSVPSPSLTLPAG